MTKLMPLSFALALSIAAHHAIHLSASQSTTAANDAFTTSTLIGNWTIETDSPHGHVSLALTLKRTPDTDNKFTGSMSSEITGELAVSGNFTNGTIVFSTEAPTPITFSGKFKDKDTIVGSFASSMGDFPCTATRMKDK